MLPLEIAPRRSDLAFVALLMGGFVLFGIVVAIMAWPDAPILTIILLVAMAALAAWDVKLFRRLKARPVLIRMDETGILISDWSATPIPYAAIASARWLPDKKTTSLGLALLSPENHPPDNPNHARAPVFNRAAYGVDIKVVISFLESPDEDIVEAFIIRSGIEVEGW